LQTPSRVGCQTRQAAPIDAAPLGMETLDDCGGDSYRFDTSRSLSWIRSCKHPPVALNTSR